MFGFSRFVCWVFRLKPSRALLSTDRRARYGMAETFGVMSAGAGFVLRLGADRTAVSCMEERAFRNEMASACRQVGIEGLFKAASSLEDDRAEFYHAIPKMLEVRDFERGRMP